MIWIRRRSTRYWSHCRREKIVTWYCFGFNDWQTSMLGAVFILHILQKCLMVLVSIRGLVLSIESHALSMLAKWLQLPERMKDMCRNEKDTRRRRYFSITFGHLWAHKLHSRVYVFLPLSLLLSLSSHNGIHTIHHVIAERDNVMQSNRIPFGHPQGPVPEWP